MTQNLRAAVPAGSEPSQSGPKPVATSCRCRSEAQNLRGAGCDQARLRPGRYDSATRWPEGFETIATRVPFGPGANLSWESTSAPRPAWRGICAVGSMLRRASQWLPTARSHSRDISLWAETCGGSFLPEPLNEAPLPLPGHRARKAATSAGG